MQTGQIHTTHAGARWGYHALVLPSANTVSCSFVVNRSGNRPSHEQAAFYFDRAISLCRRADFPQRLRLRVDTDFSQTEHWTALREGVKFVFGIDATKAAPRIEAGNCRQTPGKTLIRPAKHEVKLFFYSDP